VLGFDKTEAPVPRHGDTRRRRTHLLYVSAKHAYGCRSYGADDGLSGFCFLRLHTAVQTLRLLRKLFSRALRPHAILLPNSRELREIGGVKIMRCGRVGTAAAVPTAHGEGYKWLLWSLVAMLLTTVKPRAKLRQIFVTSKFPIAFFRVIQGARSEWRLPLFAGLFCRYVENE